ncbi:hypothetical protein [Actinomadura sp. BRA 177]|uniref:hypothetical protein n=1 Tax=Actinomadura sp. BRA 177 TaxID=2745202 RepID=UPI0020CFBC78|nr:hypothetical protein [Actinomadura sp. BRA 177]
MRAVTPADLVAPLDGLDLGLDVAAAVPSNSTTAFLVLDRVARIEPGDTAEIETAREFGYDDVVLRDKLPGEVMGLTSGRGFDIVVDTVGGPVRRASLDALAVFIALPSSFGRGGPPSDPIAGSRPPRG